MDPNSVKTIPIRPPCGCGKVASAPTAGATRPGCLDCVTKHLGAACVLLAEFRDGYHGHYLRAVGHLHEAEDESQPWPELHTAIRAARQTLQRQFTIPDFDALAAVLASALAEGGGPTGRRA